jgi:hypothetical protein
MRRRRESSASGARPATRDPAALRDLTARDLAVRDPVVCDPVVRDREVRDLDLRVPPVGRRLVVVAMVPSSSPDRLAPPAAPVL